jgi:GTP cyclohydrolase I
LKDGFGGDEEPDEDRSQKTQVIQVPVPFMGVCAHHLLPFFGSAAVGYLPTDRVVGLSKLARLVYAAGHLAPTTQENITNLVADTLFNNKHIRPRGVAVITSALHGCMAVRGTRTPEARTLVTVIRGDYKEIPALEDKFTTIAMAGLE